MSILLELLGKGLDSPFMTLVLPCATPLTNEQTSQLINEVNNHPEHQANKLRLAIHYAQSGGSDRAEALFQEILHDHPKHLDARLAWAAMHSSSGSLDESIGQLQKAYRYHQNDSRVLFGLGYCHERRGELDLALEHYEKGSAANPYLAHCHQRMAAIYVYQEQYAKAIEQCRELVNKNPEDVWNYLALGQLYLNSRQNDEAIAIFEKALTIEPDNFEMHDDQVESLAQGGQTEKAIERLRHIIDEQGGFPDSYVRIADLYSQMGDDEATINYYQKALDIYPGYLEASVKLGTQYLRMKHYYQAANYFNQAIEVNDRLIATYVSLGVAQHYKEKHHEANDTFDLAAAIEPNTNLLFAETNRLQYKLAFAKQQQEEEYSNISLCDFTDGAEEHGDILEHQIKRHRLALIESPNHADLHYRYALLLRGKGLVDLAIQHFENAVTINPCFIKARMKLGLALREKQHFDKSLHHFREALLLEKDAIEMHYKLALTYCDRIQFALTVEHLVTSMNPKAENVNIRANIILALQNMALVDRAAAIWQSICELEPQSSLAFQSQRPHITLDPQVL